MTGLGRAVLVEAQRAAAQAPTPLPHEDKVPSAAQAAVVPRPHAALAGRVAALALHGGRVPVVTGGVGEEREWGASDRGWAVRAAR